MKLCRRIAIIAATAVAMVAMLTGCGDTGTLRPAGETPAGLHVLEGVADVHPGVPQSLGQMMVCLTHPGHATITDVKPLNPIGTITVQAFAVRPSPYMRRPPAAALGDGTGPLSTFGFHKARVITIACNSRRDAAFEIGVQVTKPTRRDVGAAGWVITYTSDGVTKQLTIPLAVKLCTGRANSRTCNRLNHHFLPDS